VQSITPYEYLCLAKLLSVAMGANGRDSVTDDEADVACETLKHMAAQRIDWTQQQKDAYRLLVDCAKERVRRNEDARQ